MTPRSKILMHYWLREMQSNNPSEDMLDQLILDGIVEPAGIDMDTGDMLYSFTEKGKTEIPAVRQEAEKYFDAVIMYFWENGFVSMDVAEKNPTISITEKALDETEIAKLSSEMKQALNVIKDALRID